jgi:hypothetical protein
MTVSRRCPLVRRAASVTAAEFAESVAVERLQEVLIVCYGRKLALDSDFGPRPRLLSNTPSALSTYPPTACMALKQATI